MNLKSALKEIKLKLSGEGIVYTELELSKAHLAQIVNFSLRELTSYIDVPARLTIPYTDRIDLSEHKIDSIMWIVRAEPRSGSIIGGSITDPFYASSVSSKPGSNLTCPNYSAVLRTQLNYLTTAMAQNTVQSDLAYITDYYNKTVDVTYSGVRPNEITIFYRPVIESLEDLPSNYWYNYVIRMSVAYSKIIIGQTRSKFSVNSSPISLSTDFLNDGKAELEKIREELDNISRGVAAR